MSRRCVGLFVLFFTLSSTLCVFPDRWKTNECSLIPMKETSRANDEPCEFQSRYGTGIANRLLMNHGEKNCTLKLSDCRVNVCYGVLDYTSKIKQDQTPRTLPSSIFKSVKIDGADLWWDKQGFRFKPKERTVTITYETLSCAEFYAYRGYERRQFCNVPFPAVSSVATWIPIKCE
eukprot:TRINITY_DN8919_c0_g1_i1.p1 TRINITY_DN8919_c0_g1~~TRINITY_DN8919_c0_g1_i1.p1  ORF type:complete len:176 (-),score=22.73 TRINITY_DN8919_c0_g1_i1:13-540(-)